MLVITKWWVCVRKYNVPTYYLPPIKKRFQRHHGIIWRDYSAKYIHLIRRQRLCHKSAPNAIKHSVYPGPGYINTHFRSFRPPYKKIVDTQWGPYYLTYEESIFGPSNYICIYIRICILYKLNQYILLLTRISKHKETQRENLNAVGGKWVDDEGLFTPCPSIYGDSKIHKKTFLSFCRKLFFEGTPVVHLSQ